MTWLIQESRGLFAGGHAFSLSSSGPIVKILQTLKCESYTTDLVINSGQLIFKYVFSKIFHYNHRCDQQIYIILEVVTRPFNKKYKMSNKD